LRRIVIVGGGIAGLSAAWHLGRRRVGSVTLLERESLLCTHASGRNAAIFRPLEAEVSLASLALRSSQLFCELSPERPLIEPSGLILLARHPATLEPIAESARALGTPHAIDAPEQVSARLNALTIRGWHGLFTDAGGVLDIHALTEALASASRAEGVEIRRGVAVVGLRRRDARVVGVETSEHGLVEADDVVLAAGAWGAELGEASGVALPLTPVRRHLALLRPQRRLPTTLPAVWSLDDEVYFRREGEGVLASPCDETPWSARTPQAEVQCLAPLGSKLRSLDEGLGRAEVVRYWACLRTFAPDRRPVIGSDPRLLGVHWLAGLGGFGMTTGVAAGELLAQTLIDSNSPRDFAPQRLLSAGAGDAT